MDKFLRRLPWVAGAVMSFTLCNWLTALWTTKYSSEVRAGVDIFWFLR